MRYEAETACNHNRTEIYQKMKEWAADDARFQPFDRDRLVEKYRESRENGAYMDFTDPYLYPNGQRRPLSR
jgi:hypothetical protein